MVSSFRVILSAFIFLLSAPLFASSISDLSVATGGQQLGETSQPIVAVTRDHGLSWTIPQITGLDQFYTSNFTSCVGQGSKAACVLAPRYETREGQMPAMLVSTPSGNIFEKKFIPEIPSNSQTVMHGLSCFEGENNIARCVAIGMYWLHQEMGEGFIAVSKDAGNTWNKPIISGMPPGVKRLNLTGIACSGEGSKAVCVALGGAYGEDRMDINTTDGGETWSYHVMPAAEVGLDDNFNQLISCTGSGNTAVCVHLFMENQIDVTHDSGKTWMTKKQDDIYADTVNAVSCTGSGSNAVCVIAGYDRVFYSSGDTPHLFLTQDAGNTWTEKSPITLGRFRDVSCTGDGNQAICAAVGNRRILDDNGFIHEKPQIFISTNAGSSWEPKPIPEYTEGIPTSVECKGNKGHVICTIQGNEIKGSHMSPLLAVTYDSGNTWIRKSIQQLPSTTLGELGKVGDIEL